MKKGVIIGLICGIVAVAAVSITVLLFAKPDLPQSGSLYVNDKEIADVDITIYKDYAEIPLIEMLKGVGFEVNWTSDRTAEFRSDDVKYIIDLDEVSCKKEGTTDNLLIPAPGNTIFICKESNHDIILDGVTAMCTMDFLENDVFIHIDHEKLAVYVTER